MAVVLLGHRREEAFRGPEQTQIVDAESTAQRKQVLEGERNKESRKRIGGLTYSWMSRSVASNIDLPRQIPAFATTHVGAPTFLSFV